MSEQFYGQFKQDQYLFEKFFEYREMMSPPEAIRPGYFIDIGAYDGIHCSNSYFFEKELGWKGICIEPISTAYETLRQNRNCECIHGVVSDKDVDTVEFCEIDGYCEMLSGIIDDYDPEHVDRIIREQAHFGGERTKTKVKNYRFEDIGAPKYIDFIDIDTEGNELAILKDIDFEYYQIKVIVVENNYKTNEIPSFLSSIGYNKDCDLGCDEVYVK